MSIKKIKFDKNFWISSVFIIALLVFTYIVFHLSVNQFVVVMPIFAGIVFLSIFFVKEDKDNH